MNLVWYNLFKQLQDITCTNTYDELGFKKYRIIHKANAQIVAFNSAHYGTFDNLYLTSKFGNISRAAYPSIRKMYNAGFNSVGRKVVSVIADKFGEFYAKTFFASVPAAIYRWLIEKVFK